jgi:hypothetical protein
MTMSSESTLYFMCNMHSILPKIVVQNICSFPSVSNGILFTCANHMPQGCQAKTCIGVCSGSRDLLIIFIIK